VIVVNTTDAALTPVTYSNVNGEGIVNVALPSAATVAFATAPTAVRVGWSLYGCAETGFPAILAPRLNSTVLNPVHGPNTRIAFSVPGTNVIEPFTGVAFAKLSATTTRHPDSTAVVDRIGVSTTVPPPGSVVVGPPATVFALIVVMTTDVALIPVT
jgi:hypothetical protein